MREPAGNLASHLGIRSPRQSRVPRGLERIRFYTDCRRSPPSFSASRGTQRFGRAGIGRRWNAAAALGRGSNDAAHTTGERTLQYAQFPNAHGQRVRGHVRAYRIGAPGAARTPQRLVSPRLGRDTRAAWRTTTAASRFARGHVGSEYESPASTSAQRCTANARRMERRGASTDRTCLIVRIQLLQDTTERSCWRSRSAATRTGDT